MGDSEKLRAIKERQKIIKAKQKERMVKIWKKIMRKCTAKISDTCIVRATMDQFPDHGNGEKGTICKECKNTMSKRRRLNDPAARFRHYTVTRIQNEWPKEEVPKDLYTNLEYYLGYRLLELVKYLREELKAREGITLKSSFTQGYHLDHLVPHVSFNAKVIGDDEFKKCWAISNLWLIPSSVNLQKGAKLGYFDESEAAATD